MKNSKSETIKKTFVLESRIVKALWAYCMMRVVSVVAGEYASLLFFFYCSFLPVLFLIYFVLIQAINCLQ